jgi:hypothetical protein
LHQALAHLRAGFTRFAVTVDVAPGSSVTVRQAVPVAPRRFTADYTITYRASLQRWLIPVPNLTESDWVHLSPQPDGSIDVLGIRLWLDGAPADKENATVHLRVAGEVEDPHLRLVELQYPLPPATEEAEFFTGTLLADMANLYDALAPADGLPLTWATLTPDQQAQVRANYHQFLMLRDSGRLVTLDTADLVLDLEVGRSAALEPFKRLHRYIDVMKEHEEMRRRQLDNDRRDKLLAKGKLGDPDIERVVVTATAAQLAELAVGDDSPGV